MGSERVRPARSPARVPASAATASAFLETPAAAKSQAVDADALSVVLITAGYDHTIRFWEAWSGVCSHTIAYPDMQVNRVAISPDKRMVAVAGYNNVRLYDCNVSTPPNATGDAANVSPVTTFEGHTGNITAVAWHCDAKWLVSGSEDGTLKIWDTR